MTAETTAGQTMHIGELGERTGLSLRTIRHYDEVGLVRPSGRTEGGFRLYTEHDEARLMLVRRMKPLGFSLEEMAELLDAIDRLAAANDGSDREGARARLGIFVQQTIERRAKLAKQLEMADEFLELLQER
jgi:MerR family copper efflux transcriptional regulator